MTNATIDPIPPAAKAATETLEKGAQHVIAKAKVNAEVLGESNNAAIHGFMDIAKAYQKMATNNAERLTSSLKALSGVKTQTEFFELQKKFLNEGIEATVKDGGEIAKLTSALFTLAFRPIQQNFETLSHSRI